MGLKEQFLESLKVLPADVGGFLEKKIPELEPTSKPATVDEAVMVQGILAHNLNCILSEFVGLSLLQVAFRVGQHNTSLMGLFASMLHLPTSLPVDILVVTPEEGQRNFSTPNDPVDIPVEVQIVSGEAETCVLEIDEAGETITMSRQTGESGTVTYTGTCTLPPQGMYNPEDDTWSFVFHVHVVVNGATVETFELTVTKDMGG